MTAVDAAARSDHLVCVEDCLFDRIEVSHKAALIDIWMKYGDGVDSADVKNYFRCGANGRTMTNVLCLCKGITCGEAGQP